MAELSESQISSIFRTLRNDQQQIASKIGELEIELTEHNLVISAIEKLEPARRCFRLVGGVLVERTVGEVLPAVSKNKDGILEIIKQLREQLSKKTSELNDFVVKYQIQVKGVAGQDESSSAEPSRPSAGVLV